MARKKHVAESNFKPAGHSQKGAGHYAGKICINIVLWLFSLSCIFPLIWMFYSSLKLKRQFNADVISIPFGTATLQNYKDILGNPDYHLSESMCNSFRTTAISIVLIVLFTFIVGYILARVRFKLNRPLYIMFLILTKGVVAGTAFAMASKKYGIAEDVLRMAAKDQPWA